MPPNSFWPYLPRHRLALRLASAKVVQLLAIACPMVEVIKNDAAHPNHSQPMQTYIDWEE